jgi:hypothetical protein
MALAAERLSIVRLVLRRGMGLGLVGLALGSVAAVALNRLLVGLLAEITPQKNGVTAEYIVFPDEGHGFTKKANQVTGYTAVLRFLDQYLRR